MVTITPTPIVFYARSVPRARAWSGLHEVLRGANLLIVEDAHLGASGFLKISVTPTTVLPTYTAIDTLLTQAGGWDLCPVEPKHSLFLLPKREGDSAMEDLLNWAEDERREDMGLEITVTKHPTIARMARADVIGTLSEQTFHLFDTAWVWALDPEELRAERAQSEPVSCPDCHGNGCPGCGQMGIVPCPIGGYDGEAGGP